MSRNQQVLSPQAAVFEERSGRYGEHYAQARSSTTYSFHRRLEIVCDFAKGFGGSLLECASGTGEITEAVIASGSYSKATVIDLTTGMLERAKEWLQKTHPAVSYQFVNQDIFTFRPTNEPERFDLILCLGLIAHTGRLGSLLTHLNSMLSPKGAIILQSSLVDHPGNRLKRYWKGQNDAQRDGYQISYFSRSDIREAAMNANLEVRRSQRYRIGIPFANRVWPAGVYGAERLLDPVARTLGGEAVFLLQKAAPTLS